MVHTRHSFQKDEEEHLKVNGDLDSEESPSRDRVKARSIIINRKPANGETSNDVNDDINERKKEENNENEEKEKEPIKDQVYTVHPPILCSIEIQKLSKTS